MRGLAFEECENILSVGEFICELWWIIELFYYESDEIEYRLI